MFSGNEVLTLLLNEQRRAIVTSRQTLPCHFEKNAYFLVIVYFTTSAAQTLAGMQKWTRHQNFILACKLGKVESTRDVILENIVLFTFWAVFQFCVPVFCLNHGICYFYSIIWFSFLLYFCTNLLLCGKCTLIVVSTWEACTSDSILFVLYHLWNVMNMLKCLY